MLITHYLPDFGIRQSPLAFVVMLLIPLLGSKHIAYTEQGRQQIKLQITFMLVTIIFLNIVCQFVAYYATSHPLADRAQLVPIFLTYAGLIWIAHLVGSLMAQKYPSILMISVGLLTVIGLVGALNTVSVLEYFANAWDARDQLMRNRGELTRLDIPLDLWDIEDPSIRSCIIAYYQQPSGQ